MVSTSPQGPAEQVALAIQKHVDELCLQAMEMQRASPDGGVIDGLLRTLTTVKTLAVQSSAGPVLEGATLVESAIELARRESPAPTPYLGHFVTSVAADLARVVHAYATGGDPAPMLRHARQTLDTMPRRGTDYLVEVDLSDPRQVARIFAAMGDSPEPDGHATAESGSSTGQAQHLSRIRELRQLLASYVTQVETVRAEPRLADAWQALLDGARALRASAAAAEIKPVERLARRLAHVIEAQCGSSAPPSPEVVAFTVDCGRAIAAVVDAPDRSDVALRRVSQLIEQSSTILRRFQVDTAQFGTGLLSTAPLPGGISGPDGDDDRQLRTLFAGLRALEERQPGGTTTENRIGPGRTRGDPHRFIADAAEALARLVGITQELRRDAGSARGLAVLRQTLQMLKESAALVGASALVDRCWHIESQLSVAAGPVPADVIEDVRALYADLEWLISLVRTGDGPADVPGGRARMMPVDAAAVEGIARLAGELTVRGGGHAQRSRRFGQMIQEITLVGDRLWSLARELESGVDPAEIAREMTEVVSDLSIAATDLDDLRAEFTTVDARVGQLLSSLHDETARLPLVPLSAAAPALERASRGLSERLGKRVTLAIAGTDTPVSGVHLEKLTNALLHLLRNAIDHGIEPPAARRTAGKPDQGRVTIHATQSATETVIEVSDDGAGMDDRLILERAVELGFPIPADGLTRDRALQLIFLPGLTTRRPSGGQVASGHGLDTVSTVVAEMRGTIAVHSEAGRGTTVTLRLPPAESSTRALVVALDEGYVALPYVTAEVVPPRVVQEVVADGTGFVAELGGARLPAADLGALLGTRLPSHVQQPGGTMLRIEHDGSWWLVRVDGVLGRHDVTIQPVSAEEAQLPGVVGTATFGTGDSAPVLDVTQLLDGRRVVGRRRGRQTSTVASIPFALVADVSVTMRRQLGQILERAGWRAIEARDGLEAWELLEAAAPDLLVIDLDVPLLDAAQVIRSAKAQAAIPVIALAEQDDPQTRAFVISAGADILLPKPLDEEHLTASLAVLEQTAPRT